MSPPYLQVWRKRVSDVGVKVRVYLYVNFDVNVSHHHYKKVDFDLFKIRGYLDIGLFKNERAIYLELYSLKIVHLLASHQSSCHLLRFIRYMWRSIEKRALFKTLTSNFRYRIYLKFDDKSLFHVGRHICL